MTSFQAEGTDERATTLPQVIGESGHTFSQRIMDFISLAAAVQSQRLEAGVSDTGRITRSTALWALMELDTDIREALLRGGVAQKALADVLSIRNVPTPVMVDAAELHEDFARAMLRYLADLSDQRPIDLADLAAAILRAGRNDPGGLLPGRLKDLKFDFDTAIRSIERLIEPFSGETVRLWPPPPVADVDPLDFGINIGARGRRLNPYIAREPDMLLDSHLRADRAVVVTAEAGAGAHRSVYEALVRVLPEALLLIPRRPGEFDSTELLSIDSERDYVLWMDMLGAHWGVLGEKLSNLLRIWRTSEHRWFIAIYYDNEPDVIQSNEFAALQIPVVRLASDLTSNELARMTDTYGHITTSSLIGRNPPLLESEESAETSAAVTPELLAGGTSSDLVDPTYGIAIDRDQLGVKTFVTMLATVIADRSTPMPLSIGLFGEWGSGKSYFMGLLRGQVDALAHQNPKRYYTDIIQIGFNAWHYSDSNLWASLGDEIFEQLTAPEKTGIERCADLQRELAAKNGRRRDLVAATRRAQEQIADLQKEIQEARRQKHVQARAVIAAIAQQAEVKEQLDAAFGKLGVKDEYEQGRLLVAEMRGGRDDLAAVRRSFVGWRGSTLLLAVTVGVVLVSAAVALRTWVRPGLAGGLSAVAAAVGLATWWLNRARTGLSSLRALVDNINERSARLTDKELSGKLDELRRAEADEQVLQAQLHDVVIRVGELGTELAEASPGQRLYRFVSERAASDDYRGQLGLISIIRKDFEQLVSLMKEWRERGKQDSNAPRPIDRIVLYIDDLDRCSPRQVVEVLQAVHLLLALDLFVVVVGVDPRWLLRSLRRKFRLTLTDTAPVDGEWSVTSPQDYLEKIFSIPFLLPRMEAASFASLLRGLAVGAYDEVEQSNTEDRQLVPQDARALAQAAAAETAGAAGQDSEQSDEAGPAASDIEEGAAELEAQQHSVVSAVLHGEADRGAPLTEAELTLLASLAPLVRTPRSAKRLLNLYRLLRSTRDLSPAASFLGTDDEPGKYQAVAVLLGLLTAHPGLMTDLISAPADINAGLAGGLRARPSSQTWRDFVTGLAPRPSKEGWCNDVAADLDDHAVDEWHRLVNGIEPASAVVGPAKLAAFQLWEPHAARFSFQLAPLVFDRSAKKPALPPPTDSHIGPSHEE